LTIEDFVIDDCSGVPAEIVNETIVNRQLAL